MRVLFFFMVVLVGLVLWKLRPGQRLKDKAEPSDKPGPSPQTMLRCVQCSTHVPAKEALSGQRGPYCCAEHRQQAEGF